MVVVKIFVQRSQRRRNSLECLNSETEESTVAIGFSSLPVGNRLQIDCLLPDRQEIP